MNNETPLTESPRPPLASSVHTGGRRVWLAFVAAASVVATSTAGRLVSAPGVAGWYKTLVKPSFNPPNWAFPVAWTLLFVLMGLAFYRVLRAPAQPQRRLAVALFLAQLVVNVCWSLAFFGAHSPLYGLIVIIPFLAIILVTLRVFLRVDKTAGLLLVPYAAWVAFATVLNLSIFRLNPG